VKPGPVVGRALAFLLDLRFDEGVIGADEAGRRLDTWCQGRAARVRGPLNQPTGVAPGGPRWRPKEPAGHVDFRIPVPLKLDNTNRVARRPQTRDMSITNQMET